MRVLPADDLLTRDLREVLPGASAAWLFGSGAQGLLRADSDIDIAVRHGEPLDAMERFELAIQLAKRWGRDVDLLDFARLSPLMQVQVIEGRKLFDDDPVAGRLEVARALRQWQDDQRWPAYAAGVDAQVAADGSRAMTNQSISEAIGQKATRLHRCIVRAREEKGAADDFATDFGSQDAAILNVQRACECAIDIAKHGDLA